MHEPYVVSPFGAPFWLGYANEVAPAKQFQALCHFVFTDLTLTVDTCPINQPASHVIISHYQIDQIICRSADTPRSGRFTQVANRLGHFVSTENNRDHNQSYFPAINHHKLSYYGHIIWLVSQ